MTLERDEMWDLIVVASMEDYPSQTIEQVKAFLKEKRHPQQDNAAFVYDFWRFCNEDMCISNI